MWKLVWTLLDSSSGTSVPQGLGRDSGSADVWETSSNEDSSERSDNEDGRFSETETEECRLNMCVRGTVEILREPVLSSVEVLFAEVAGLVSSIVGVRTSWVWVEVDATESEWGSTGEKDEDRLAEDCDPDGAFDDAARDFCVRGFFGRASGRAIRRSSSHCRTAISSSSPFSPSATKLAIFAHLVSSIEGMRLTFNLDFPFSLSFGSDSPSSPSFEGDALVRPPRTLRRRVADVLDSPALSLALAPGRNRQSG